MIHFIGAGPGDPELLTIKGYHLIEKADVIIYAGSLVNPDVFAHKKADAKVYNSAYMTLEDVLSVMKEYKTKNVVRLHSGDPSLYGAIREQMDVLEKDNIPYDVVPGVSSFCAAAAALPMEYTLPNVGQSVILTRIEGKTKVPQKESIASFAKHQTTMVLFLSSSKMEELVKECLQGGYKPNTPAALVYRASWPDQKVFVCTLDTLVQVAQENGIYKTALIIIGETVSQCKYEKSRLYDASFTTEYRKGRIR